MKGTARHIFYTILIFVPLVFLGSCANIVKPTGGPKDTEGPVVDTVYPANKTLNFNGDKIEIHFNEFLKMGSYSNEVFISPIPNERPSIYVKNKKLIIKFNEELLENTTYVITVSTEIKDYNESNKMDQPFVYAFSTGEVLDSMRFSGTVEDPWTGANPKDMVLLLFPEDSVPDDSIFGRTPLYVTQPNESGYFDFQFIRPGKFRVYGVQDVDKNFKYNQITEKIALCADPKIDLTDTIVPDPVKLLMFTPDNKAPEFRSARWITDQQIKITFSEKIKKAYDQKEPEFYLSDTLGNNVVEAADWQYVEGEEQSVYLFSPTKQDSQFYSLQILYMMDSLGNLGDTLTQLRPNSIKEKNLNSLFAEPKVSTLKLNLEIQANRCFALEQVDTLVQLLDSSGTEIPLNWTAELFTLKLNPDSWPAKGIPHTLRLKPGFQFLDGYVSDSLFEYKVDFPDISNLSTLSGRIVADSADTNQRFVMLLEKRGQKSKIVRRLQDSITFKLSGLEPGKYSIKFIGDRDGNGYWTPGSLHPYTLPELIYVDPKELEIKANWEFEEYNVFPKKREKGGGRKSKIGAGKAIPDSLVPPNLERRRPGGNDSLPPPDGDRPPPPPEDEPDED